MTLSRSRADILNYLASLRATAQQCAINNGYAVDADMSSGFGLRKVDCGETLTRLGKFLGFRVDGKREWSDPSLQVDGGEFPMPYPGADKGKIDYVWKDNAGRVQAVFETDGRDNDANRHLPLGPDGRRHIKQHIKPGATRNSSTNNLFKLSTPVLQRQLDGVPGVRVWVLFQIRNPPDTRAKGAWKSTSHDWRGYFNACDDLSGALVISDTELFGEMFVDYLYPNLSNRELLNA